MRRSGRGISIQLEEFAMEGDRVVASATSGQVRALGWQYACSNIPAAYLTGYLAGLRAKKAGVEYAVLDIGMQNPKHGGVLFAAVAGMCDAGLEIPHGDSVVPSEDRLNGRHIDEGMEAAIGGIKKKMEDE